jgi:hypothetical protein
MADGIIASGVVHSDVEGERLNLGLKMVLALMDLINKPNQCSSDAEIPVITWTIRRILNILCFVRKLDG